MSNDKKDEKSEFFPPEIRSLPMVEPPFPGMRGWTSRGPNHQIIYFDFYSEFPDDVDVIDLPEHTHAAQFGVCLDGEMEITIDGVPGMYRKGDHYYIPAGVPHSARFWPVRAIDFFAEPDRWPLKK